MPTTLRASLRTIADEIERRNYTSAEEKARALADAPATVAELLPLVAVRREVHWTCHGEPNAKMRATLEHGAIRLYWTNDDTGWMRVDHMKPSDLTAHAQLVEVG